MIEHMFESAAVSSRVGITPREIHRVMPLPPHKAATRR
jgi:hypothetical protein